MNRHLPTVLKHDVIHKTGSIKHIAKLPEKDRATSTGNMHTKFGNVWPFIFCDAIRHLNKQTENKQTDILILIIYKKVQSYINVSCNTDRYSAK